MLIDFFEEFRFDLSNKCPLKCDYCTVSSDSTETMTYETFEKGMNLIEQITTIHGRRIQLFGAGEPLCDFSILKHFFNTYENKLNFQFELITNGLLLTKDVLHFLEDHNIEIHLSLDGTKELHDKHRITRIGSHPTWDIIMNNISYATKPLTGLVCTMTSDTIDLMPYMYNSLQKINAKNFFLNFDKYDSYSEDQQRRYIQHLKNFCDRDYSLDKYDNIIFKGKGTSCANFMFAKQYLDPKVFKTFRNTAKDLIIDINGNLKIDLPQHTSQMAKGARELGFLKPFGSLYGQIDWNFCENFANNYGQHFEKIYFYNQTKNCSQCSMRNICQPYGQIGTPYIINDNCCFYYKTTVFPYRYLKGEI